MLNRIVFILLVVLAGLTSCKKENKIWNKEGDLATDTSIYLNAVTYVSHTDLEAIFDIEIVQFNNLTCKSDFSYVEIGQLDQANYNLTVIDQSVEIRNPVAQYSSLFLIEESGNDLNYFGEASFYLSRFFEQTENKQPNKQIAIATFLADNSNTIKIHKENGNLYGNSAEYNDSILADVIHKSEQYFEAYDSEGNGFVQVMFTAIDEIVSAPNTTGDQSITVIDDYVNNGILVYYDSVIDSIVNYAKQQNVKINIITLSGAQHSRLAIETGGFLIDDRDVNKVDPTLNDYERSLSSIGNNIANLDRILSQNITVNKFRIQFSSKYGYTFVPNSVVHVDLLYGQYNFILELKIP